MMTAAAAEAGPRACEAKNNAAAEQKAGRDFPDKNDAPADSTTCGSVPALTSVAE